jgi:hypothetical protein
MSCYFRHMRDLFEEAGVEVTKESRKALHLHIAGLVGDEEAHCPTTWRLVKEWRDDPGKRAKLVARLGEFSS